MERKKLIQAFSRKLTHLMRNAGFTSNRVGGDVDISKLAKMSGCSYQMARRYVLGMALPELDVVIKIAKWLNTSPSWLLFGENDSHLPDRASATIIQIDPELLKYILDKSSVLFSSTDIKKAAAINFIVDNIYDISHLESDQKTARKIFDMTLSSILSISHSEHGARRGKA